MKRMNFSRVPRVFIALLTVTMMMGLGFAGTSSPDTVLVASADELTAALSSAATSGKTTIITYAPGTSEIDLGGSTSIPTNVTLDLIASKKRGNAPLF